MPKNYKTSEDLTYLAKKESKNRKILSMLGFAMRARKLLCGTDKVCDEIRRHGCPSEDGKIQKQKIGIVIIASDASDNTKKRIINACNHYNVGFYRSEITSDELADRIGRISSAAVCATFDKAFTDGILKAVGVSDDNRLNEFEQS